MTKLPLKKGVHWLANPVRKFSQQFPLLWRRSLWTSPSFHPNCVPLALLRPSPLQGPSRCSVSLLGQQRPLYPCRALWSSSLLSSEAPLSSAGHSGCLLSWVFAGKAPCRCPGLRKGGGCPWTPRWNPVQPSAACPQCREGRGWPLVMESGSRGD